MVELYQLQVFCRVYELRSVSRTAREFNLSQPAVSSHLRRLEKGLSVKLFTRQGRQLAPTQAAEILYDHAQGMLSARDAVMRRLKQFREGQLGRVSVGASSTGVIYFLPPVLTRFREVHPDIGIIVRVEMTDRIREAVAAHATDVGLVWGPVVDQRLAIHSLGQDDFTVIAHPAHPLASLPSVPQERLADQPFILPPAGTTTRQFIESRLREVGIVPHVAMEFESTEGMKKAVEANLGVAVVARKAVERELALPSLAELRVKKIRLRREMALIWAKSRTLTPPIQQFINWIRAYPVISGSTLPSEQTGSD